MCIDGQTISDEWSIMSVRVLCVMPLWNQKLAVPRQNCQGFGQSVERLPVGQAGTLEKKYEGLRSPTIWD